MTSSIRQNARRSNPAGVLIFKRPQDGDALGIEADTGRSLAGIQGHHYLTELGINESSRFYLC